MQIELSREEAELLRDTLQQQVKELDKEINRTESLKFKRGLQENDRAMERILGRLAVVLERPAGDESAVADDHAGESARDADVATGHEQAVEHDLRRARRLRLRGVVVQVPTPAGATGRRKRRPVNTIANQSTNAQVSASIPSTPAFQARAPNPTSGPPTKIAWGIASTGRNTVFQRSRSPAG